MLSEEAVFWTKESPHGVILTMVRTFEIQALSEAVI